jgi:hypothetical protein
MTQNVLAPQNYGIYKVFKGLSLMKREAQDAMIRSTGSLRPRRWRLLPLTAFVILTLPSSAHASIFHGETLDAIANGISWVVLIIGPIIGIAIFWLVHILPEKIAWPIAWLWAYTKPVLHKMAYGTDVDKSLGHVGEEVTEEQNEIEKLRARIAELEAKRSSHGAKV